MGTSSISSISQTSLTFSTPQQNPSNLDDKSSNIHSTIEDETITCSSASSFSMENSLLRSRKLSLSTFLTNNSEISCNSFIIKKEMKKGKYAKGKLWLVTKKTGTNKLFVLLSMKKQDFCYTNIELENLKDEIEKSENVFLSKIRYFFQNPSQFYFVQDYFEHSNIKNYLEKHGNLNESMCKFYLAEIIIAFELLPKNQTIIHKFVLNFSPKIFFFDSKGHILINILSVILKENELDNENADYMSPELLNDKKFFSILSLFAWKIGALLCEMSTGDIPFHLKAGDLYKHSFLQMNFSQSMLDLLEKLLISNPAKRLGSESVLEIKNHSFFEDLDWEIIKLKKIGNGPILEKLNREKKDISSLEDLLNVKE